MNRQTYFKDYYKELKIAMNYRCSICNKLLGPKQSKNRLLRALTCHKCSMKDRKK